MRLRSSGSQNRSSSHGARLSRKVLILVACILSLVLVFFLVVRCLFPSERLRELAVSKLEEATGLSISVKDAAISFVHWRIGVKVTGIEVSGRAGGGSDSTSEPAEVARLASIPRLGVVVSVLPLLKREIVVDEVYVERPTISLNLGGEPVLRQPRVPQAAGPSGFPMSLSLSKAVVNDGEVKIRDVRSGSVTELRHLDASSSIVADRVTQSLSLEGKSSVKEVLMRPARKTGFEMPSLSVKASWKARFGAKDKLLELERVSVRVAELPIEAAGKVNLAGDRPELDVRAKIEKVSVEKLLAFVPKQFLGKAKGARANGQIEASATIRGKMPSPEIDVERFLVSAGGSRVSGRVQVRTEEPRSVNFESSGNLKLDELAAALNVSKAPRVKSGTASFSVSGGGLIDKLKANPLSLLERGEASMSSVAVELPPPSPAAILEKGDLVIAGRSMEITGASARVGSSVFSATGRIRDLREPFVELEVRSPALDLGELLAVAKQENVSNKVDRKPAVPAVGIPARGSATLQVDKLKFGSFGASDLRAHVVFGQDSIVVSDVTMSTLGGKCGGKTRLLIPRDGTRTYTASFSGDNLELKELLNSFTPVKEFMTGVSSFEVSVEGRLPEDASPLGSLVANGRVRTAQAKAIASPLVSSIASLVGLEKSDQYALRDFVASFLVKDGRVILPQCRLEEKNSVWDFTGSTGFDGTLDYRVNVALSQEYSRRMGSLNGLEKLLKDDKGRVVVDLIVGGTVKKPVFRWDRTRMQERGKAYLAQKVQGELAPQIKKGEEVQQKVKTDLEKGVDSLRAKAAKKGADLLDDLLKKRK